jgi:hypothetical protein
LTPLTRAERSEVLRNLDFECRSGSTAGLLKRALLQLDAMERDFRWLAIHQGISEADWAEYIAPWVEP